MLLVILYGVELIVVSGRHHDKADFITAIKEEAEEVVNLFFNEMAEKNDFQVYLEVSSKYESI
jgi:hypothetical protein